MTDKVLVWCLTCQEEWFCIPAEIYRRRQGGCPACHQSNGEQAISQWFDKHNIPYTREKTFEDCRHIGRLRFDFYCPDYRTVVEFNGLQHYEPVDFGGKGFEEAQACLAYVRRNDRTKKNWAKQSKITFLVIPYTEFDKIALILAHHFKTENLTHQQTLDL